MATIIGQKKKKTFIVLKKNLYFITEINKKLENNVFNKRHTIHVDKKCANVNLNQ